MSSRGCQRVREVNDGATGVNEGRRKKGGKEKARCSRRRKNGKDTDVERMMGRMSAGRHKRTAHTHGWRNELERDLESETEWSAGGGRWSWLNPCPEYCTNCGIEADTIAERSPVASINKIN